MRNKDRLPNRVDNGLRRAMRECVDGRGRWPMFLTGGVGTGKTCAALCLLDHVAGTGFYSTLADYHADHVLAQRGELQRANARDGWRVTTQGLWSEWIDADLAVLDEIGTRARPSDALYETLKRCIDSREGRPTIFTSNITLSEIAQQFDERIASRIGSGTPVELAGGDRRYA